ncbi:hypothetical protein FNV43_RR12193 [Rhamnella rubrinervis]|uniref:DYW domain-containing protein n=1 Tax=Rhamnella rubrinervis TaxID=2594499 RepID=A0A8K0H7W9_9ROSA|nr:hypothetical protein FNV43_RR12193 [Rhamnella rubrinervis]
MVMERKQSNYYKKMKEKGIEPDRVTYIGVLTACSHEGLLVEGRNVFNSIKDPDVDHYACLVDPFGRVGDLDEAKKLIESMPKEPHAGVYGSLLNASRIHRRMDLGELAANKLFELEPQNSGNYILLSNLYASKGRWEDVQRVREDDIYKLLATLRRKMRDAGYAADKSCVLRDVEEEEKEEMVGTHSENLAICFALLVSEAGAVIRVKNLRMCWDCHTAFKMISKLEERKILVRDNNRFHCFSDGLCSCNDYWHVLVFIIPKNARRLIGGKEAPSTRQNNRGAKEFNAAGFQSCFLCIAYKKPLASSQQRTVLTLVT